MGETTCLKGVRLCLVGAHFPISQVAAALEVGGKNMDFSMGRFEKLAVGWMKEYLKL